MPDNPLLLGEALAVALSVAYILFAVRESIWCWPCALGSTAIYTFLFWEVQLPMEAALNLFYLGMAIYGWYHWTRKTDSATARIHRWSNRQHLSAMGAIALATIVSGWLLDSYRPSAVLPYLDSFTTWAAVLTTWMVARKVLENWLYWIVINLAAMYLYLDRELYLTLGLYCLFFVMAVVGWNQWRKRLVDATA